MPDDAPGEFARLLAEAVEAQLAADGPDRRANAARLELLRSCKGDDWRESIEQVKRCRKELRNALRTARETEVGDGQDR